VGRLPTSFVFPGIRNAGVVSGIVAWEGVAGACALAQRGFNSELSRPLLVPGPLLARALALALVLVQEMVFVLVLVLVLAVSLVLVTALVLFLVQKLAAGKSGNASVPFNLMILAPNATASSAIFPRDAMLC